MQTAAATLAGNAWGAKDRERLSRLTRLILFLEIGLMILSGSLLFVFSDGLMRLFSQNENVVALGAVVLRMVAVSEPFYGATIVLEGIMQGLGKTTAPFVYNVFGMWCVRIAGTFVCINIFGYGLVSAWACMIGHNLLLFLLFMVNYAVSRRKGKI